jgi:hypothetical protein
LAKIPGAGRFSFLAIAGTPESRFYISTAALDPVIGRPLPEKKSGLSQLHLFSEQHGIIIRQTDPLAKLKVVPVQKLRWQNLAPAARERLFWPIFNEPRRSHGVRLKPVHGAEDFPSLHWMGVGGEEGFCFHRGKEHGGRQTDACDY